MEYSAEKSCGKNMINYCLFTSYLILTSDLTSINLLLLFANDMNDALNFLHKLFRSLAGDA